MEKLYTVIAEWSNGVKRTFKHLDKLNVIINKAELEMWCEKNKFIKPKFTVIEE